MENIKKYIEDNFITKSGVISSKKINDNNIKFINNLRTEDLEEFSNTDVLKFYYIDNGVYRICKQCNNKIPYSYKYFSKEFCNKKCSAKYTNNSVEQKEKYKQTCLEKYGVENIFQNQQTINKIQEKRTIQKKEIAKKISQTLKNKDIHPTRQHLNINFDISEEYLRSFIKNNKFNVEKFMNITGYSYSIISQLKQKFNIIEPNYNKRKNNIEIEISKLVDNSIINNNYFIKPYEIDVFSEKYKMCIEYNGLMWHSYGKNSSSKFNNFMFEDKNKHLEKTKMVEEKGYQLFHIFENEWLDPIKKQIWKSVINSKMNKTERIYARKCTIKEVNSYDSKQFLENNHLQGAISSSIRLGLYYNNELVQIMTFGKSRMSKKYEYELYRMCNKINITVIGGFSKLLKHFEKVYKPKSLISYANRRWSQGNVYENNGFKFLHNSIPNHFWFNSDYILFNRINFQKHKLKDKLEFYDKYLTADENMFNNKYRKIYDSGNKIYIKEYNEKTTI